MLHVKTPFYPYLIATVAYLLIARFILGGILFSPGTVGFFHDWAIGPFPEMIYSWANEGFYIWDSQLGNKIYPTDWLFRIIFIPFSFLGGEILSKVLLVLVITLSGLGAFTLGRQLKLGWFSSSAVGILYIFSPIIFTKIIAGHLYYLLAYALAPFIVFSFLKGKEEKNSRYFIVCGILLCFAISQFQFLIMMLVVLLIFSLVDFKHIRTSLRGLLITFTIAFVVVLMPVALSQLSAISDIPLSLEPRNLLSFIATITASDMLESFRLLGYESQPYSYLNLGTINDRFESNSGIMPPWIFYLDFLLPIAGFLSLMFRRDRYAISFAIIAVIGLFLLKGNNPPFQGLSVFLFLSGFYLFREIWHIAFLYGFSITFLVSFLLERLKIYGGRSSFFKLILPSLLVVLIVVSNGYPLLTTNFAGYLQTYNLPTDYRTIYRNLSSSSDYNILTLPLFSVIRYDGLKLDGVDPLVRYSENEILPTDRLDRPQTKMATWLLSAMIENKTNNLGSFLTSLGIQYIILRKDFSSNFIDFYEQGGYPDLRAKWDQPLEPFLDAQKDLAVISDTNNYKIYKNTNNVAKIFIPTSRATGLSDFNSLLLMSNLTSLSNIAFYPLNNDKESPIVFLDTSQERQMSIDDFYEIGKYAEFVDPNDGWTHNRYWFGYRYPLDSRSHTGAFSMADGAVLSFKLPSKYVNEDVEVWIKALQWDKGGNVDVNINGKNSSLNLFSLDQKFILDKVFEGKSSTPFQIVLRNIDGANYVEGFYIKPKHQKSTTADYYTNKEFILGSIDERKYYLISNPSFLYWQYGLPLYWMDTEDSCKTIFTCEANFTDGWRDHISFEISTMSNENNTWSWISSKEVGVSPGDRYELVTHMKMNKFAFQSHIVVQGFNENLKSWYHIAGCPNGSNGPMKWHMFSCEITIPRDTSKIRLLLNAGWSSQMKQESVTLFDEIFLSKLTNETNLQNLSQIRNIILANNSQNEKVFVREYSEVNPTSYKARVNASQPFTLALAQPYDAAWEASVYKNGTKIESYNSIPLYGVINGFEINQTGNSEIVLRYTRQEWFEIGLIISAITLTFCIAFLFYDWKKNRQRKIAG
jgi:hypothetical protein